MKFYINYASHMKMKKINVSDSIFKFNFEIYIIKMIL